MWRAILSRSDKSYYAEYKYPHGAAAGAGDLVLRFLLKSKDKAAISSRELHFLKKILIIHFNGNDEICESSPHLCVVLSSPGGEIKMRSLIPLSCLSV